MQADNPVAASATLNDKTLESFYEDNLVVIYRFIYSKVGNREEAEDLTSQVFVKALRGLDAERDAQSMQSWLFQVARTTIADHWRQFYRLRADSLDDLLAAGWEAPAQ
ncbi:MAG: sigma factor, partial [Ktedonobacterales bacterium]